VLDDRGLLDRRRTVGVVLPVLRLVRTIGVLEVLGALGLILPPLTGIAPALAIAAAIGLVLLQVGGISLHLSRGEAKMIGLNVALLVLAGVEIWLATVWL
jgi:hypothetical protein